MSRANVEVVRRAISEWNRDESEASLHDVFDPEVEFFPLRAATEGPYRGITGIQAFIADTKEVFARFELHFELRDVGDEVLAWGPVHVRAHQSGIDTEIEQGGVFTLSDGKIIRWQAFASRVAALKAVGLEE